MQYLLLLANAPDAWEDPDAGRDDGVADDWVTYTRALSEAGVLVTGAALQHPDTATSVRLRSGERLLTDGPFTETREHLIGVSGVPDRPGAWLTTTAWRKALDVLRRERFPTYGGDQPPESPQPPGALAPEVGDLPVTDDLLRLVLTCCHPALAIEARVALTLRHVAGMTTREIAAAFLVSEATMAKRLVRARAKIRDAGMTFELPDRDALPERLAAVHSVVYLVFTEGHLATGDGPAIRAELCDEAVWLARQLHALVAPDGETTGLLAQLLLQHSRNPARQDAAGLLIPYDQQDRGRWDADAIAEARRLLAGTGGGRLGPYQVQAAIAALHAAAPDVGQLRWASVADLYRVLARLAPSPVVEVNRAVAVGRADGPRAGLAILAPVLADGRLEAYAPCTPPTPTCSSAPETQSPPPRRGGALPTRSTTPRNAISCCATRRAAGR